PMTTPELCELAGLTRPELQRWIDAGLLEADRDGRRREFGDDDRERARLIKALHTKGLPLSRLAREKSRIPWPVCHLRWPELVCLPGRRSGNRRGRAAQMLQCARFVCDPCGLGGPLKRPPSLWHRRPELAPDNSVACQRIDALPELIERHSD